MQLERGDAAAQELVNSLQVLEVMTGAMSAELKPLVKLQRFHLLVKATSWSLMTGCVFENISDVNDPPPFCVAAGASAASVHLPAASIHGRAPHGCPLRWGVQQDRHAGDHEQLPGAGATLAGRH